MRSAHADPLRHASLQVCREQRSGEGQAYSWSSPKAGIHVVARCTACRAAICTSRRSTPASNTVMRPCRLHRNGSRRDRRQCVPGPGPIHAGWLGGTPACPDTTRLAEPQAGAGQRALEAGNDPCQADTCRDHQQQRNCPEQRAGRKPGEQHPEPADARRPECRPYPPQGSGMPDGNVVPAGLSCG